MSILKGPLRSQGVLRFKKKKRICKRRNKTKKTRHETRAQTSATTCTAKPRETDVAMDDTAHEGKGSVEREKNRSVAGKRGKGIIKITAEKCGDGDRKSAKLQAR